MSGCFSLMADETIDILTNEKLSMYEVCLSDLGINYKFMYGQEYDGANNMAGEFRGVQKIINDQFFMTLYVHYSAHSLNLAVLVK
ncbi:Hypothetical protein CINCED_3A023384 [Cinara cedri]|uniref:DUF4371 domain-containing protein n=1 Tax=Cinara cedri TaxID=506608 RepID=A0A5E4N345_9HEMI|nr:Hypothetical protein CINCED_3A023384 [Cinara cedri]